MSILSYKAPLISLTSEHSKKVPFFNKVFYSNVIICSFVYIYIYISWNFLKVLNALKVGFFS